MTVSRRTLVVGAAIAATLLVVFANAHLVYVSMLSRRTRRAPEAGPGRRRQRSQRGGIVMLRRRP
jgi:hypothetical protein